MFDAKSIVIHVAFPLFKLDWNSAIVRPVSVTLAYSVSTCIAFRVNYILNFYILPFAVEITWPVKLLRSNSPNPAKKGLICSGRDKNWYISTKSRVQNRSLQKDFLISNLIRQNKHTIQGPASRRSEP